MSAVQRDSALASSPIASRPFSGRGGDDGLPGGQSGRGNFGAQAALAAVDQANPLLRHGLAPCESMQLDAIAPDRIFQRRRTRQIKAGSFVRLATLTISTKKKYSHNT